MRDTEVGCEACADKFRGFRSARFALEQSREELGDHLCNVFDEYFSCFVEVGSDVDVNVPQLSRDY